jgi:hypothetical protein
VRSQRPEAANKGCSMRSLPLPSPGTNEQSSNSCHVSAVLPPNVFANCLQLQSSVGFVENTPNPSDSSAEGACGHSDLKQPIRAAACAPSLCLHLEPMSKAQVGLVHGRVETSQPRVSSLVAVECVKGMQSSVIAKHESWTPAPTSDSLLVKSLRPSAISGLCLLLHNHFASLIADTGSTSMLMHHAIAVKRLLSKPPSLIPGPAPYGPVLTGTTRSQRAVLVALFQDSPLSSGQSPLPATLELLS